MIIFLIVLFAALVFEYINGFHDSANAIATSISTRALMPRPAIMLAAAMNLLGALWGTAVAKTISEGLVDAVAMDIKNSPDRYDMTAGEKVNIGAIKESAAFLMESGKEYEFRTTVVKELHRAEDFVRIGQWLKGAERYFLQAFRDGDAVLRRGLHACSDEEMHIFKELVRPFIPNVKIRGET